MQLKTCKFIQNKLGLFLPVLVFLGTISAIALSILIGSARPALAGPTPGGTPTTVSISVLSPTVDIQFNQSDIVNSRAKESSILVVNSATNNSTGAVTYISSTDENTSLKHVSTSVSNEISSINSQIPLGAFPTKSWGYREISQANYSPIPKASSPDVIYSSQQAYSDATYIFFGAKPSSDLPAGTYSKQIVFTTITNAVPKIATFKPGRFVKDTLQALNPAHNTDAFKHSSTPPANLANTTIVSTDDSTYPIYVWYNSADKTIYWWSEADDVYANEDASAMFYSINSTAPSIVSLIDIRGINFSKTTNMMGMFSSDSGAYKKINIDGMDTSNVENMSYMFASGGNVNIVSDPIDISHLNTSKVKSMESMFKGSFTSAINMTGIDTSNVENISFIFQDAKNVTSLNLANLNVSKVVSMMQLFFNTESLTHIDLSNWNLRSMTSLQGLFRFTSHLESVNLSGFQTAHITDMSQMFMESGVKTLDLSSFDTGLVTNMELMFKNTKRLTSINLSSFNTASVTNMNNMFSGASEIQNLDLSLFNTSNVTNMSGMLSYMTKLTNLNVSNFDTRRVTDMSFMFSMTAINNGVLDLSSFNSQSLTNTAYMFDSSGVKTIYTSPQFALDSVTNSASMFWNNNNLVGGNGTTYSNGHPQDKTYARIDAPGTPGYFTQKP